MRLLGILLLLPDDGASSMDCELACSLSSNYCIDCDAGQAELTKCTKDGETFVQRECADVSRSRSR